MSQASVRRPGQQMSEEIHQQPEAWRRLLAASAAAGSDIERAADRIAASSPRFVLFAARGTSDHAALYAKYLTEIVLQLPAGLVSPSTLTTYSSRPDLRDVLMIGVSQSGGSPDLVQSLQVGGEQGALTVAVTNNPDSPLARAGQVHVDVLAGPELAVAATKSYTSQLLALFLLVDRLRGGHGEKAAPLPDLAAELLGSEEHIAEVAQRYRFAARMVTTGRGYSYPTAREAALKLMETSYLSAQAFSGADLLHGPLAMIEPQVPVLTVQGSGRGGRAMAPVLERLAERDGDIFCVGTQEAVDRANAGVVLPEVDEEVSPLLEILPFQQLALHLAVARGQNPDAPRGLAKITETL